MQRQRKHIVNIKSWNSFNCRPSHPFIVNTFKNASPGRMNLLECRRSKPLRFEPRRESCSIGLSDLGAWVMFVCAPPPRGHRLTWGGGGRSSDRCGLARKIIRSAARGLARKKAEKGSTRAYSYPGGPQERQRQVGLSSAPRNVEQ